jgi:hypothetical protein
MQWIVSETSKHEGHRARFRESFLDGKAASQADETLIGVAQGEPGSHDGNMGSNTKCSVNKKGTE